MRTARTEGAGAGALKRIFLIALLLASALDAAAAPVVVISIDQFRYDYLTRFAPWFGERGFRRFEREGARYTNARQRHAVTSTGPGHAVIGSGLLPSQNGIIANRWLERDAPVDPERWRAYFDEIAVYRTPGVTPEPFDAKGDWWWKSFGSPRPASDLTALLAPAHTNERVISIALTDRAAILMGGHGADAYWFDGRAEKFVSTHGDPRVLAFNELVPGYMPATKEWRMLDATVGRVTYDPPQAWSLKNTTYGGTFPHPIPTLRALQYTPFAHAMIFDLAQHILAVETPDLLFVGVSSTDYLGHLYGPDSMEVADSAVRLDRALGAFLDALERRYGRHVLVALTSDHGVQSIPEIAKLRDRHADAGRIDLRVPGPRARFIRELPPQRIAIERALASRLHLPFSADAPLKHALVYFFDEPALTLNWPRIRELHLDPERVKRELRDVVRGIDGVAGAWTNTETLPPLVRNSFYPARSGDVLIALRPGWIWHWGGNGTTHGQPVEDDLHVPLMLWGAGVKAGVHDEETSPQELMKLISARQRPRDRTDAHP